ncbi:MAG: glycosyltransferase family 2 protein [Planctomycetota bacterium]
MTTQLPGTTPQQGRASHRPKAVPSRPSRAAVGSRSLPPFHLRAGLSVVVPVYNEVHSLRRVLDRILEQPQVSELVLVDDGSTDGSGDVIRAFGNDSRVVVRQHATNRGKGAALRTGFAAATGDFVLVQDADDEYDPRDYGGLLEPLVRGEADVVYGSRWLLGPHARNSHWLHTIGNRVLTAVSNFFTGLDLTDMETCYKAFHRDALDGMEIRSRRFTVEPELTAKIARRRLRVFEVPISYRARGWNEGKKIGWRDGVAALGAIVWFRFRD